MNYSAEVRIGRVTVGGGHPVAVQTMTNTDTLDVEATVGQIIRAYDAGCRIVRMTAQGKREGYALEKIASELRSRGYEDLALVADIHFTPEVALIAADYVDKVRINPGNYYDSGGQRFRELLSKCRRRGVAVRIGVNHGSLAPHIVEKWGDTPAGMVESAMEFLNICHDEGFDQVVVSMKSSNVRVMVHAYRLLAARMEQEGMAYPLHLGVTEAGDGMDGRVKSAVGIGSLLADGIGDTIRVSLTEPPENEIPVAFSIVEHFRSLSGRNENGPVATEYFSPYEYRRRDTAPVGRIGGDNIPLLFSELDDNEKQALTEGRIILLEARTSIPVAEWRDSVNDLASAGDNRPVILGRHYETSDPEKLQIAAACDFGPLFIDGLADGIRITAPLADEIIRDISLSILQAARVRISHTEYIACPGCGRTLFDLPQTLDAVRSKTNHLTGLKIGVMGCIVNGPGEMADADYGYVGAGRGRVTLYKGKQVMVRDIPQDRAVDALIDLIKENGDWTEPRQKR